jgi:hypothetical protein
MPDASAQNIKTPEKLKTFLKAALSRLVVYGGMGLAIAFYFTGFRGWLSERPVAAHADAPHLRPHSTSVREEADWPQWRGKHNDAHSDETGLADSWPAEGPPVLWSREIGHGYSSVIAVGSCIYTQTQTLFSPRSSPLGRSPSPPLADGEKRQV